jgi:hypothetical protein
VTFAVDRAASDARTGHRMIAESGRKDTHPGCQGSQSANRPIGVGVCQEKQDVCLREANPTKGPLISCFRFVVGLLASEVPRNRTRNFSSIRKGMLQKPCQRDRALSLFKQRSPDKSVLELKPQSTM